MYKTLNGSWLFRERNTADFMPATVPGCNFLDLMSNDIIPDPFDGLNEEKCAFVGEKDWEYLKKVTLTADELKSEEVYLHCKILDTLCIIRINGEEIAFTENCHIGYRFPVKKYLKQGENEFSFLFLSPVNYVKDIAKKTIVPPNANGMNGIAFVRKPQCHFGWDWGPVLVPSGISGEIGLEFTEGGVIESLTVTQEHTDGKVRIDFTVKTEEYKDGLKCLVTLTHPDGKEETLENKEGSFSVENPEFWWTRELSGKDSQPLYKITAELKNKEKTVSKKDKKIGLRTLVLDRSKDEYGTNFRFVLNGVPVFTKGANLIPSDTFITRFDMEKMKKLINSALYSNFNIIRIWGGGYYESDSFYDLCDEKGILLWQDFAFACQPYPFFEESFLANVKKEIEYNVTRLSHHPSLALWCGNNEIETMSGGWMHLRDYIKWTEIFFYEILEKEVRKYDKYTSFIPGSPCGAGYGKGINSDNVGDTHLWSVWHGMSSMKEYRNRMTRFCSEFGFESLPDIKTVRSFAKEEDYNLDSAVMKSHQKCNSGNGKMLYYIRSRFRLPEKFEDFIYLSQVTQLKCIEDATEHWRRNKGRCNGAIWWQFNDCWPVCSWSSVDYYGNYKALQYGAKHFNRPLTVSFEDSEQELKAYLINDLNEDKAVKVSLQIFDFEKGIISREEKSLTATALTNTVLYRRDMTVLKKAYDTKRTGVLLSLYEDSVETARRIFLFHEEKDLELPKSELVLKKEVADDRIKITLGSGKYARLIRLESASTNPFSDNCFDLLPGEEKTVTLSLDSSISDDVLLGSIKAVCLTDIPTRKITAGEIISQTKLMLSPVNIGNMIFHKQKPKDVKV